MIYPSVIMFVAIAIVTLLMMVVVPQFQTIFEQMLRGAPLPGPTQIVIGISDFSRLQSDISAGRNDWHGWGTVFIQED
jgi:type IV pilus assembly protein PilC